MNFRHRYLVRTIRILLGLLFLLSGITGLLGGPSAAGIPAAMAPYMQSFWNSGILQMIKVTEIVGGLMLITGFLPWLAAIFVAPICIGVIIFNARVYPALVISGVVISVFNSYLGYAYWDKYKQLFRR